MTDHERAHLQQVANVLKKWVNGPPRKKYGFAQREADRKTLEDILKRLLG